MTMFSINVNYTVLFTFWRKRKSAAQSILLMGLSDSGKTLIYARLLHSKFVETYTSAKENLGYILVGNVSFEQYFMIELFYH